MNTCTKAIEKEAKDLTLTKSKEFINRRKARNKENIALNEKILRGLGHDLSLTN